MNIKSFFGVIAKAQTYSNLLFLLLAFPLGIFYFVFLVTGISLGLGLIITIIGAPIVVLMLYAWNGLAAFERGSIKVLLNMRMKYVQKKFLVKDSWWVKLKYNLLASSTWKNVLYLFIKFPLGIFSFTVLVTLLSVALSLIGTPVMYHLFEIGVIQGTMCAPGDICFVNSYIGSFIWAIVGVLLLFIFLNLLNFLAKAYGLLAKVMLEKKE